ncbi:transcriptional regulator, GntR family [Poseidonocella pacifica]|uniref:Transcriptional regulator, GntR family n=1 Tax=Poseidonocella pacifica TaxID=871651 RepID=A0A1I0XZF2_9RHOB|nr:GntR family transcriptional regulator [Poseidonocella pacifica]SFB06415.1 transcriptional regulator, GntR family [Poseidonocella pacifica]
MSDTLLDLSEKAAASAPLPAHARVYHDLRAQILFGELAPGEPVTIQGLCERLSAGTTPVREAIRRLCAEGALEMRGNRRICVPDLAPEALADIMLIRRTVEPELARRATKRVTSQQIEDLEIRDRELDETILRGDLHGYLRANYIFHRSIYRIAQAPVLADFADLAWLRFGPSLRVVCGRVGTTGLPDRHKEILDAMRKGDADGAAEALRRDTEQGMALIAEPTARAARFD